MFVHLARVCSFLVKLTEEQTIKGTVDLCRSACFTNHPFPCIITYTVCNNV